MRVAEWPELHCPNHLRKLEAGPQQLTCPLGEKFEILKGIPRFVNGATYADHFGAQWNRYRLTQLDSHTGLDITRQRLLRCLSAEIANELSGKQVLECGCGAGRFTEVLLGLGSHVTSIDLSTAVEANAASFPPNDRHRIAQADLMTLPFRPQSFDVVICLGVVQHTPSPEQTIRALYSQVAPGGVLVIDHYTAPLRWYLKTAPLARFIIKRLSPPKAFAVTDKLVDTLLPLHRTTRSIPVVASLVGRLSPVITYYRDYPQLSEPLQREWAFLDTHDVLTDHFKHFRTRDQIRNTMESLGMQHVWCEPGGNGIEARGRRPL